MVELSIKKNIIQKMTNLGAEIVYIDMKDTNIPLTLISSLIADEKSVKHFMIRDVRNRLSICDVYEVNDFINSTMAIRWVNTDSAYKISNNKNTATLLDMWDASTARLMSRIAAKTMKQFIQVVMIVISIELKPHYLSINIYLLNKHSFAF